MMLKILLHGFGTFPIFFKELIELARSEHKDIEWSIILPTAHYLTVMQDLLGTENVLYLHKELAKEMNQCLNLDELQNYQGNIYRDIESDKVTLKKRPAMRQLRNAVATYRIYKEFVTKIKPDFVLFGHIETHEGMILYAVAKELSIHTIFPVHTRNLGGSFFSLTPTEKLPPYACVDRRSLTKAMEFVQKFRNNPTTPQVVSFSNEKCNKAVYIRQSLLIRFFKYLSYLCSEKENRSISRLRIKLLNNLPWYRDCVWRIRAYKNSMFHDISRLEELPKKFIYYPLQYTPESSINIPAPYYIDQKRVIDAIRFSMPSEYLLVVKEHPSCITVRPGSFIKSLQKCAGVVIAHYKMNSMELIKKADLTISVTGTATFEAFLLGKPSITLGETFFSEFLGGVCEIRDLPFRIKEALGKNLSDQTVINGISKIYSVSHPFILKNPGENGDPTLYKNNIEVFLSGLIKHVKNIEPNIVI